MAILFTDAFTRANGQLGTGNWTAIIVSSADGPLISSNKIIGVSGQTRIAKVTGTAAPTNQYAQLVAAANYAGAGVRFVGTATANVDGYLFEIGTDSSQIQRYDDGINTAIQTQTNRSGTQTIKLAIWGSVMRCYIAGVQDGAAKSDATYSAAGACALETFGNAASAADDFEMGDAWQPAWLKRGMGRING